MQVLELEEKMRKLNRHMRQWCARHGVSPVEIVTVVLVLGVLASLIVPPFSTASPGGRDAAQKDAALRDALQFMRTQITVFKAQHHEVPPGFPAGNLTKAADAQTFVDQLSEYSDDVCNLSKTVSPQFPLGKYVEAIPANPITGNAAVWVTTAAPAPDPKKPFGWIYNPQTLDFRPNLAGSDAQGIAYSDY
jgi:type II secretory pathway pseudopilin PulG